MLVTVKPSTNVIWVVRKGKEHIRNVVGTPVSKTESTACGKCAKLKDADVLLIG